MCYGVSPPQPARTFGSVVGSIVAGAMLQYIIVQCSTVHYSTVQCHGAGELQTAVVTHSSVTVSERWLKLSVSECWLSLSVSECWLTLSVSECWLTLSVSEWWLALSVSECWLALSVSECWLSLSVSEFCHCLWLLTLTVQLKTRCQLKFRLLLPVIWQTLWLSDFWSATEVFFGCWKPSSMTASMTAGWTASLQPPN